MEAISLHNSIGEKRKGRRESRAIGWDYSMLGYLILTWVAFILFYWPNVLNSEVGTPFATAPRQETKTNTPKRGTRKF
jgi:hypothetical protein